eukprot:scaffold32199_cov108-Isochrysis_galbana.AAC.4
MHKDGFPAPRAKHHPVRVGADVLDDPIELIGREKVGLIEHAQHLLPPTRHRAQEALLGLGEGTFGRGYKQDQVGARKKATGERGVRLID